MSRHIFLLLNIWTAIKILLAAFLILASSDWGRDRALDNFMVPVLLIVATVQLPILLHGFLYTRRMSKQEKLGSEIL